MKKEIETHSLEEKLHHQLRTCGHILHRRQGHKISQERILTILLRHGPMTQRELMNILNIRSASLSEILGKIEADGYITRARSITDRRNVDIVLTSRGQEAAEAQRRAFHESIPPLFAHLSDLEKEQLSTLLEQLLRGWEEDSGC